MTDTRFRYALWSLAIGFTIAFCAICVPPLMRDFDPVGAALDGFVNPFAAGYATDILFTYAVLAVWIFYDATVNGIRKGWIALPIGLVPGVAAGLAVYLLMRTKQLADRGTVV